ncbi:imelysin family protein [Actinomadura sp. 9N215]|uniref:imelysin family protein n=1 Tax=Actinomadura sp. 9N215 TaxID=3375150 RepID=UPI003796FE2D
MGGRLRQGQGEVRRPPAPGPGRPEVAPPRPHPRPGERHGGRREGAAGRGATGKVTGEEEAFSHTDLVDFKANVDGAKKIYELLKPVVQERDAQLAKDLDGGFGAVEALLRKHEKGDGYVSYDKVGKGDRKELADAVNALGEPLSKLAEVVAK